MKFFGYLRPDGAIGVRNHLLVMSVTGLTGPASRRIAQTLRGARLVTMPYGGGIVGKDWDLHMRTLTGFALNANVGAILLIGSDPPKVSAIEANVAASGKPVISICLDDCGHDVLTLGARALRAGIQLMKELSRLRRQPVDLSSLFVGMECGRSDPSSGMVSNPLAGEITDRLIGSGGSVVFGETLEWLGAEHLLRRRAATPEIGQALVNAVERREALAVANGVDLLGVNPGPTNIAAGLSTIEEKSLGAIAKSGSMAIAGLLAYAERPPGKGLYAMDAPAYAPESVSGFVAAGTQMILFTTGVGNSYVSTLAPTIKISANPRATADLKEQIDFDASPAFRGEASLSDCANELLKLIVDVASGTRTYGEILDEGDEVVSRIGEAL
jgi:altronate dehydratase large subunit